MLTGRTRPGVREPHPGGRRQESPGRWPWWPGPGGRPDRWRRTRPRRLQPGRADGHRAARGARRSRSRACWAAPDRGWSLAYRLLVPRPPAPGAG